MLIDTDVLIWYLRGNDKAAKVVERQAGFFVSVVTYIELVQGMRNKQELIELRRAFQEFSAKVIYIMKKYPPRRCFLWKGIFEPCIRTCGCADLRHCSGERVAAVNWKR